MFILLKTQGQFLPSQEDRILLDLLIYYMEEPLDNLV